MADPVVPTEAVIPTFNITRQQISAFVKEPRTINDLEAFFRMVREITPQLVALSQTTADQGVADAAAAQLTANTAVTNAATAEADAQTGITNAAAALVAANAAQATANAANDTTAEAERIRDVIGASLVAGANVTIAVNDAGDTMTIAASTSGAGSSGKVNKSADQTAANYTAFVTLIGWDAEDYDTANFHPISSTVTITIASPGVITWTGHNFLAGAPIVFTTSGALPTGLTAGTTYFVVSPAANTFQVSATPGGSSIVTTGSQSGTHTATNYSRLTVPAAVTKIRLSAYLLSTSITANLWTRAFIFKNGLNTEAATVVSQTAYSAGLGEVRINMMTPPLTVVAGDYFEVGFQVQTDTSITIASTSWFAMEVVA